MLHTNYTCPRLIRENPVTLPRWLQAKALAEEAAQLTRNILQLNVKMGRAQVHAERPAVLRTAGT